MVASSNSGVKSNSVAWRNISSMDTEVSRNLEVKLLEIWWDIEIALPNGWYDTEQREYR